VTQRFGCQTMHETLRVVMVRPPDGAFGQADPSRWHYTSRPDLNAALDEHAALVEILRRSGAEVVVHDQPLPDHADALFVHDPVLVTDAGAIILRMGKLLRRGEEEALAAAFAELGVPVLGRLTEPALAEGGDLLWLDRSTLAAGLGFRTNADGLHQLAVILAPLGVTVVPVPLPHGGGPDACLHLMSLISVLDHDLVGYSCRCCRCSFVQLLASAVRLVEVPEASSHHGAQRAVRSARAAAWRCAAIRSRGNPREEAGCEVPPHRGDELRFEGRGAARPASPAPFALRPA
jgi:N-dimethylarginine dimethylaminohydrolase